MQKVYRALGITFLFVLAVCGTAAAQGTQVSGTVTSATTGEKLWGVTVRVKGTQTQTVTDQQGRYSLVAPADATLSFAQMQQRHPGRVLEKAVKGMLPKGPLGYAMIKKLKCYAGTTHPHTAQQPKSLEL